MRVLFVSEYFPPKVMGGGEININLLAQAIAKKGWKVSVLTSYHPGLERYEEKDGMEIFRRLKTGSSPKSVFGNFQRSFSFPRSVVKEIKQLYQEQKIDLVHFVGTSLIAAPELKHLGIPLVATIESYSTLCPKGDRIYHGKSECKIKCSFQEFLRCQKDSSEIGKMKNKAYLKYNLPFLSYVYSYYSKLNQALASVKIIAISSYVQNILQEQGHPAVVIPNALQLEKFTLSQKNKSEKAKITYFGALIESKGPQVLIEAMKGLDCCGEFYGDGILKSELEQAVKENSLQVEIKAHIPYEDIPQVYADADIIVFPSVWPEPFGRIAIEAMAAGKPVIGSAMGGIKETIAEGAGILVEPGNVVQLREKLSKLIADEKLRQKMGKIGKKAAENYAEEKVIVHMLNFYNSLLPTDKILTELK